MGCQEEKINERRKREKRGRSKKKERKTLGTSHPVTQPTIG